MRRILLCFTGILFIFCLLFSGLASEELPLLVNAQNTLSKDYVPKNLVKVPGTSYKLEKICAEALAKMQEDAKKEGHKLPVRSAYRDYATQTYLYQNKVKELFPYYGEKAYAAAAMRVAVPGTSEHQTGLAVDVGRVSSSFGDTEAYKWLNEHCHEYGFIIRYKAEKTPLTGIIDEPWHIRYVGVEHAKIMEDNDWCLEEYIAEMEALSGEDAQKEEFAAAVGARGA